MRAMSRSAELTGGRRWGIFGLTFLIGLVLFGILMIWVVPLFKRPDAEFFASLKQYAITFMVVMGVFQMFMGIVEAVSYALLRQDKEGMTHEQLARVFD